MLKLENLLYEKCKFCGAPVASETKIDQHSNGEWNETQQFQCGYRIHWTPNFREERVVAYCSNDPSVVVERLRVHEAINSLVRHIKRSKFTKAERNDIYRGIDYNLDTHGFSFSVLISNEE